MQIQSSKDLGAPVSQRQVIVVIQMVIQIDSATAWSGKEINCYIMNMVIEIMSWGGGVTNYLGVPNSGEGLGEAIHRDSASSYQGLAGEKNLEGFLQVSTIFEPPKAKSDAQNPSILRQ